MMPPLRSKVVGPSSTKVISNVSDLKKRINHLPSIFNRLVAVPEEWAIAGNHGEPALECLPCKDYETLYKAFCKAMKWGYGLDLTFTCMLAITGSVKIMGEPLWMQCIGPPGCGKTTLCEALNVANRYVKSLSLLTGFHSGKVGKDGEDVSVIAMIKNKTFITKDGDTILKSKNRDNILSEARDLFDRCSRTHYRSGLKRNYENWHTHWILCGTSSLRDLDSSELGERFLRVRIMKSINAQLERDIGFYKLSGLRQLYSSSPSVNGKGADSPDMVLAKQLTGGYVNYLRENMDDLIRNIQMDDDALQLCLDCGTFVSYMRSRQSKKQSEETQRELSTRLQVQFCKLGYTLAAVLNKDSVDEEVQKRLRSVALDSSDGKSFEVAEVLYRTSEEGMEKGSIWTAVGREEKVMDAEGYLSFMRKIEAIDCYRIAYGENHYSHYRWRLRPELMRLYKAVVQPPDLLEDLEYEVLPEEDDEYA